MAKIRGSLFDRIMAEEEQPREPQGSLFDRIMSEEQAAPAPIPEVAPAEPEEPLSRAEFQAKEMLRIFDLRRRLEKEQEEKAEGRRKKKPGLLKTLTGLPGFLVRLTGELPQRIPEIAASIADPQRTSPTARTLGGAIGTIGATAAEIMIPGLLPLGLITRGATRLGVGAAPGEVLPSTGRAIIETAKEVATLGGFKFAAKLGKVAQAIVGLMIAAPQGKRAIEAVQEVQARGGSVAEQVRTGIDNGVSQLVAFMIVGRLNAARGKQLKLNAEVGGPEVRKAIERQVRALRKASGVQKVGALEQAVPQRAADIAGPAKTTVPGLRTSLERAIAMRVRREAPTRAAATEKAVAEKRVVSERKTLANMAESFARQGRVDAARTLGERAGLKESRIQALVKRARGRGGELRTEKRAKVAEGNALVRLEVIAADPRQPDKVRAEAAKALAEVTGTAAPRARAAPSEKAAKVQPSIKVFITKADKATLRQRGFTKEQIRQMRPADAEAALRQPAPVTPEAPPGVAPVFMRMPLKELRNQAALGVRGAKIALRSRAPNAPEIQPPEGLEAGPPSGLAMAMGGVAAEFPPPPLPTVPPSQRGVTPVTPKPTTRIGRALGALRGAGRKAAEEGRKEIQERLERGAPLPEGTLVTPTRPGLVERGAQAILRTRLGGKAGVALNTARNLVGQAIDKVTGGQPKDVLMDLPPEQQAAIRRGKQKITERQERAEADAVVRWRRMDSAYATPEESAAAWRMANGGLKHGVSKQIEAETVKKLKALTKQKRWKSADPIAREQLMHDARLKVQNRYADSAREAARIDLADERLIPPGRRNALNQHELDAYKHLTESVELGFLPESLLREKAGTYIRRFREEGGVKETLSRARKGWQELSLKSGSWRARKHLSILDAQKKGVKYIEDVAYSSAKGLLDEARDIAVGRFFKDVILGQGLAAPQAKAPSEWVQLAKGRGSAAGRARKWGVLADKYVHPSVAADIEAMVGYTDPGWAGVGLMRSAVLQATKSIITRNPASHARQLLGNFGPGMLVPLSFSDQMDIDLFNPTHWRHVRAAQKIWKSRDPLWKEFQRSPLYDSDLVSTHILKLAKAKTPDEMFGHILTKYAPKGSALGRADRFALEKYRASDQFLKLMGFVKYRREGYKESSAIRFVQDRTPNYNLIPSRIRAIGKSLGGSPFPEFAYDSTRVQLRALSTPRGMLKALKGVMLKGAMVALAKKVLNVSDKDLEDARTSGYISPLASPLPIRDERGNLKWWDPESVAPAGWMLSAISSMLSGKPNEVGDIVQEGLSSRVFAPLVLSDVMEALIGQERFLKRDLYDRGEPFHSKVVKGLLHIGSLYIPGSVKLTVRDILRRRGETPGVRSRPPAGTIGTILHRALGLPIVQTTSPSRARIKLRKRLKRQKQTEKKGQRKSILEEFFGIIPKR